MGSHSQMLPNFQLFSPPVGCLQTWHYGIPQSNVTKLFTLFSPAGCLQTWHYGLPQSNVTKLFTIFSPSRMSFDRICDINFYIICNDIFLKIILILSSMFFACYRLVVIFVSNYFSFHHSMLAFSSSVRFFIFSLFLEQFCLVVYLL